MVNADDSPSVVALAGRFAVIRHIYRMIMVVDPVPQLGYYGGLSLPYT